MNKSTFRVRVTEAPRSIIVLFARSSHNLTPRQRAHLVGGAA